MLTHNLSISEKLIYIAQHLPIKFNAAVSIAVRGHNASCNQKIVKLYNNNLLIK